MEVARAMEEGVRLVHPDAETVLVPVADGGDGTLDVLVEGPSVTAGGAIDRSGRQGRGRYFQTRVTGPLGEPVTAAWGVMGGGRTAVVEMARASGLALMSEESRDPRITTTRGTGELISAALDGGYREVIVGLGGSATNDGGAGMAQALGARLTDDRGADIPAGGAALAHLDRIDLSGVDPRLKGCRILAATDVTNPLCGPEGASFIYGPQKGATPAVVEELDATLKRYAEVVRRDVGVDILSLPRAGAAGGLGAGLVALLGAELASGGDIVCDAVDLNGHLEGASLVLTGEGQLDGQTVYDKAPIVVARRAAALGIPVIAVAGSLGEGYQALLKQGITAVEAATPVSMPLQEALARAHELVREATERAVRASRIL